MISVSVGEGDTVGRAADSGEQELRIRKIKSEKENNNNDFVRIDGP